MRVGAAPRRFGAVNWLGLWTLVRRDLRRVLVEYRDTVLGPAVSGLLFLAVFRLALGGAEGADGGATLTRFLAPGLTIFAACQRAFETAAASLIFDKLEGMLADTLMAPLTPVERALGYAGGAACTGLLTGAVVLAAMLPFVDLPLAAPAAVLFFAVGGTLLHALLGVLVGLWAERWDHYSAALTFLVIPLAFLSGTFYSIERLPAVGQQVVALNPVFYVIDGFRYGFIGRADGSLAVGLAVVVMVDLLLFAAAWRLFAVGYKIKP
ncbi:MAG TPA: ABC transporter permease [Dongiaceae bacterium]|nr:ABC transporter permease [Dongiaceae bacterium]